MKAIPRDSQRQKCYDAEKATYRRLGSNHAACERLSQDAIRNLVWTMLFDHRLERLSPYALPRNLCHIEEVRFSCRQNAIWSPQRECLVFGYSQNEKWLVCHEVAHALTLVTRSTMPWDRGPWHDWRWAQVYLSLLRRYVNQEARDTLEEEFITHNVKYQVPV